MSKANSVRPKRIYTGLYTLSDQNIYFLTVKKKQFCKLVNLYKKNANIFKIFQYRLIGIGSSCLAICRFFYDRFKINFIT